jgi:hypothetical protein
MVPVPRREVLPYQVLHGRRFPGFLIESLDRVPESPKFWIDGDTGILYHNPLLLVIFPDLPETLKEDILAGEAVVVEEKHQRHFNDALHPWGMDRGGAVRVYEVPVIHIEDIGDIRNVFNTALGDGDLDTNTKSGIAKPD